MTDSELDAVYTRLCKAMTQLGEANAPLFLARFALLAIDRIGDVEVSSGSSTPPPEVAPRPCAEPRRQGAAMGQRTACPPRVQGAPRPSSRVNVPGTRARASAATPAPFAQILGRVGASDVARELVRVERAARDAVQVLLHAQQCERRHPGERRRQFVDTPDSASTEATRRSRKPQASIAWASSLSAVSITRLAVARPSRDT